MQRVGCLWGFRDREELLAAGAQRVIAHPKELLAE
jgi:phosphoglycolate phosphatase-like HAD superfamily hydrolase